MSISVGGVAGDPDLKCKRAELSVQKMGNMGSTDM